MKPLIAAVLTSLLLVALAGLSGIWLEMIAPYVPGLLLLPGAAVIAFGPLLWPRLFELIMRLLDGR
jgi:hypothetical protein